MPYFRIIKQFFGSSDAPDNYSSPQRRNVDWRRDIADIPIFESRVETITVAPGQEKTLFDGTRSLLLDGTTVLSVDLVAGTSANYRFRWTGGTNPGFRTDRALTLSGATLDLTLNANSTATLSVASGSFAGVLPGDILWIPGTEESITSPFHVANQGFWSVLAATSSQLVITRDASEDFEGLSEAGVVCSANNQIQAFSADGVQKGDSIEIAGGFSTATRRTYSVSAVTHRYLEVVSGSPVPSESGIQPGAAGFLVYTEAKTFVYLESDQDCVVRANGDTSSTQRVAPWMAGSSNFVGSYERTGPTWSLKVLNRSTRTANISVISAE